MDHGIAKYGTPVQAFNGRSALWDAYEEVLDLAVYLKQRLEEEKATIRVAPEAAVKLLREETNKDENCRPEGTRESLSRSAAMLELYGPDCFPADDNGQIHFARAMMESVSAEIRSFLKATEAVKT